MKATIDFHRVPEHQQDIHARLLNWAAYVRVRRGHPCAPMWRFSRSNTRMWHMPEAPRVVDTQDGAKMESAVGALPRLHAKALRWFYVYQGPPARIARELAVTYEALARLVADARSLLCGEDCPGRRCHSYTGLHPEGLTE